MFIINLSQHVSDIIMPICMVTIVPALAGAIVPMHPHHPPYSKHTRSRTPIQPQPPFTIHKTHAKV